MVTKNKNLIDQAIYVYLTVGMADDWKLKADKFSILIQSAVLKSALEKYLKSLVNHLMMRFSGS
jgi:hypothetical protein